MRFSRRPRARRAAALSHTPRGAAPRRSPRGAAAGLAVLMALTPLTACSGTSSPGDAVAIGGSFQFHSPGGQTVITYPEEERQPLSNFSGESLLEPDTTINLTDYDGTVVVLNAWGQWCGPCRSEVDDLVRVHEQISPQGGTVLGINIRDNNIEAAQDFVRDNDVTYPSIYDPPFKTAAFLGGVPASVVPTTIVLDKQHRPAAVFLKEVTDKELLTVVTPLLEEQLP